MKGKRIMTKKNYIQPAFEVIAVNANNLCAVSTTENFSIVEPTTIGADEGR